MCARLADGVDPAVIRAAESVAGSVPGVLHAHARRGGPGGRCGSRSRAGWIPGLPARDADALGREVAAVLSGSFPTRAASPGSAAQGPPETRCKRDPLVPCR